ncbi:hypothetical protein DZC78_10175 [Olleya aquimaris]|uniref:Resistance protein Rx N-terminal domain-containing protein n=1 Tax=Olleya sediminilitoris TaxID=2795739 RepID=A0ABS1WH62_9FLAO|nr:resistance protein Rx N-terminal domain-containing protein [Olleya sediminilitoris]AXO80734.1 hypothetical protein DZC78_10175 [Olleya aquimaris]MBL7558461.1 resistance protein Rx N-terminal domain-containing protein [Olleya sediminilitoris]
MFAYQYAENNFNYAYKGNYNNIFLYNDSKPKGFEVIKNDNESSEIVYIPVEIDTDNPEYVKVLEYEWFNQAEDFFKPSFESNKPKVFTTLIFDYLLKQGYIQETGSEKIYQPVGYIDVLPQELFIYNGTHYISTFISTINDVAIDEVIVSASAYPKPVKPFLDFDDALDKTDNQLIVMVSSNGAKIDHAYIETTEVNPNEIVLYIEDKQDSNLFGSSVRVKSGSNFSSLEGSQKSTISRLLKAMDLDINRQDIIGVIKKHLQDKKNKSDVVYYLKRGFFFGYKIVSVAVNVPSKIISEAVGLLIKGVEYLKIEDNHWKYYNTDGTKNDNYDSFLPFDTAINKLEKNNDFINAASSKIDSYLDTIKLKIETTLQSIDNRVNSYLKNFTKFIFKALKTLKKTIAEVLKKVTESAKDFLIFINALVVGLINSLLDTVLFILGVAKALFNPDLQDEAVENLTFNTKATLSMFLEVLENGVDIIITFISQKVLGGIIKFVIEVYGLITNPSKASLDFTLPKADQVGYFIGAIVGFIVEEVIGAMLTLGTYNAFKASQLVYTSMKNAFKSVAKTTKKAANTIGDLAKTGVVKIINLIDVIKDFITKLPKYLDDLVEWLKSKLLTAKAFLDDAYRKHFKESIRKQLEKLGIRPTKFDEATDTFTFCPIKSV